MELWQVSAVVLAFLGWLTGPVTSVGELARREALRRDMAGPAAHVFTNQDLPTPHPLPAPTAPAAESEAGAAAPAAEEPAPDQHDETWWRNRITTARATLEQDHVLADALQSRVNGLTTDFINRDDPVQKQQLFNQRQQALAELDKMNKQIVADEQAISDILEDARKAGVPPGWVRD